MMHLLWLLPMLGLPSRMKLKKMLHLMLHPLYIFGNRLSQVVDALDLSRATMAKVYQNLSWAIAYNVVAIPIAAGVLLPQYDFAMTPSLSGGLMALSSVFVVTNSLLLQLHRSETERNR